MSSALAAAGTFAPAAAGAQDTSEYRAVSFDLSLVPGLSIGAVVASATHARIVHSFSLNVIAGRAARLNGVEVGAVWNDTQDAARGLQLAGFLNTVGGDLRGVQAAGFANYTAGAAHGLQLAGLTNASRSHAGTQVAGLANFAAGTVTGAQVSGFLNVARSVSGVQAGLINIARHHDGVPIGLVSFVGSVGLRSDSWMDETGMIVTTIRSGNRKYANFLGMGAVPGRTLEHRSLVAGFGREFDWSRSVRGSVDLIVHALEGEGSEWATLARLRTTFGVDIGFVQVFAGPSLNVLMFDDDTREFEQLVPRQAYSRSGKEEVRVWPGYSVGIRL